MTAETVKFGFNDIGKRNLSAEFALIAQYLSLIHI